MLNRYKTVRQLGSKEIVIKKSRFIGFGKPVATEAEAIAFIEEMKKQHWNATHNCSAYMIGERDECQKQSDDGEPSGTAGKPILEVMKNQGLKNTVIVVTRYFGGIMLGAGGLIRAYTDGAVAAIEAAEPITQVLHQEVIVDVDYTWYGKLENELHARGVRVGAVDFTDRVIITCLPEAPDAERFTAWIIDVTQGQAILSSGENKYFIDGE
ncbi:YigZ family protein [Paenibacillus baekrokdamisoli]|uniref:YigZ family protein n=1 Tax=Paenibacillus baekrokdamisoli TaxID=1712516 RepID=A0A3G9J0R5_9BACL|nr:YigZ family protein [Paenibacillus baekrokdamisoli]MBB3072204.1 putative YigZ family protein [Paenibacillus baekrokdamisoli]BBH24787.1 YigZ family protein [Paenibacillus baekrokdamisoli]